MAYKNVALNPATIEAFFILGTPGSTWGYSHFQVKVSRSETFT